MWGFGPLEEEEEEDVSGFEFMASGFWFLVSNSGFGFRISGFGVRGLKPWRRRRRRRRTCVWCRGVYGAGVCMV